MSTLETAGYAFEPMVHSDVFGSQSAHLYQDMNVTRSAHAALPSATGNSMQIDLPQGSGVPAHGPAQQQQSDKNVILTAVLVGALALLFMYQGSV